MRQACVWGPLGLGRRGILLALGCLALVCLVAGPAWAAVPNRSLSFVAVAGSTDPVAVETARRVARHAERRLGLNPRKIHVIEQVPTQAAFEDLFRRGAPFQYVSQGDVVVVFIAGAREKQGGLQLADGVLGYDKVFQVAQHLKNGPGEGLGFFSGTVLLVLDRGAADKLRTPVPADTAVLDLLTPKAPPVDPALPAPDVRDALAIAGRGALAEVGDPGSQVTAGAVAWVGALERSLAGAGDGSVEALRAEAAAARDGTGVTATLLPGPGYEQARFRLLIRSLRVVLHPTLLANVETIQVLEALRRELERAVPPNLRDEIKVERLDEPDPSADVSCAAVANRTTAHLECVEGRAPVFADQLDVTNPEEALAPVVRQVLRDYKALAATDWSARRRDLKPLDVVLLLDTSLSMAYHDPTRATDPRLPDAPSKREIILVRLAATLSAHAESTGRPARLTVLLFGDKVVPLGLPGGSTVVLNQRLDAGQLAAYGAVFRASATPMPYTGIRDALTAAVRTLAEGSPEAARHVILLTDGRESVVTTDAERAVRDAAAAVHALGATLHVVGLTEGTRLAEYLTRMRAGGDVLRRYVELLDMTYAPVECRRSEGWDEATSRKCGDFYARTIEKAGAYDPFLLDRIRRAERPGVPTGVFLQPDSSDAFQAELQTLLSALTGGGIYLSAGGDRTEAEASGRIVDRWRFDLDLQGTARVVLYNRTGLSELKWRFTQNDQPMGAAEGVQVIQESAAVTLVTLPAPARGIWVIEREGVRQ